MTCEEFEDVTQRRTQWPKENDNNLVSLLIFFSILFMPYSLFLYLKQLCKDYKCFEKILFKQSAYLHNDFMNLVKLIRKDIDVNEHESISNTTLRQKLIKE